MQLYRAFATVGGMTMISRVLGFVRDILIAAVIGTGVVADAFFVAFRFPNLFRRLFAEGAFNSAFIPLFAKELEGEGKSRARVFAEEAMAVLLAALLVTTAVAELLMPWLMYLIAPGFASDPEKFNLSIVLTQIAFPYLTCMSLVALLSGILNALGRFAAAAAAPILLNVVLIGVMLAAAYLGLENRPESGVLLAWGVAFAGLLQLAVLYVAASRQGFGLGLRWPKMTPGVKRLLTLGIPGVIAGGITQVNILIGTIIASWQESAVSYLYYADRIYQLPLGIVGIAIGVVLLPDLSRRLRQGDEAAVIHSQNRSLEFSLLLTLPAAVALFIVPEPIIRVLFERGAFEWLDTQATSAALAAFAWGLPAFVLIKVFSPAFFAREDTKTPMYFAGINMLVNVVLSMLLFMVMGHVGIALATSVAAWVNVILLYRTLVAKGHFEFDERFARVFWPIIGASLLMGAVLWGLNGVFAGWFAPSNGLIVQFAALSGLVGAGLVCFAGFAQLTGAVRLRDIARQLRGGSR